MFFLIHLFSQECSKFNTATIFQKMIFLLNILMDDHSDRHFRIQSGLLLREPIRRDNKLYYPMGSNGLHYN